MRLCQNNPQTVEFQDQIHWVLSKYSVGWQASWLWWGYQWLQSRFAQHQWGAGHKNVFCSFLQKENLYNFLLSSRSRISHNWCYLRWSHLRHKGTIVSLFNTWGRQENISKTWHFLYYTQIATVMLQVKRIYDPTLSFYSYIEIDKCASLEFWKFTLLTFNYSISITEHIEHKEGTRG